MSPSLRKKRGGLLSLLLNPHGDIDEEPEYKKMFIKIPAFYT
jgi:hypothetical protein